MTYLQAKKLHNGDEVMIKKTEEIVKVYGVELYETYKPRLALLKVLSKKEGWTTVTHYDVE